MNCEVCGDADSMRYTCSRCGGTYCVSHRLPESHDCAGLAVEKAQREIARAEGEEIAWFNEGNGEALNESSNLRHNTVLLAAIMLLAAVGIGYFILSVLGGVL